ncbi:MAG: hypothetical protein RBT78_13890, partial [Kiritimatiellia bacterium]|nr:hypothetical protein [Kiritimatiellia bacterium]
MKKASCVVAAVLAFVGYVGAEPVLFTEDGRWTVPTNQWDHVYAASNGLPEVTDARWVTGGYQSTTPGNVNYVRIVNDEKEGDVLMLVHTNSSTADNRWPSYQIKVEPGSGTTNDLITVDMRFRLADDSQSDTTSQLSLGLARPRLDGTEGRASWYLEFAEKGIKKNGEQTVYGPALGLGWHTVRVVIDVPANRAKVYLDHLAVPVISGWSSVQDASVANHVMFGDSGTALQGMAGIKFLRWTTRELAEPATWLHRGAADPAGEGWSYEPRDLFYTATNSVLPEASFPAWVKSGFEPGGSSIVTDEITGEKTLHLIMTNRTDSYGYARYFIKTDEGTFATNHITTCRMRFRLVDETQTDDRYQLNCGLCGPRPDGVSGRQAFYVMFSKDRVRYYDDTVLSRNYMVDLGTNWHEMIWTQNWRTREARFYLDGSPEPVFTHLSSQDEYIMNETTFGDGSSAIYGIARVSEFHLTRQGVVWSGGAEEGTNYW